MRLSLIADSYPGAGHLVRAYALAEAALTLGHTPTLITKDDRGRPPSAWDAAPCPTQIVRDYTNLPPADLTVVDSYRDVGLVAATLGTPVVAYDDIGGLIASGVKAIVNPNVGGERFGYPGVILALCGARYATIRAGFPRIRRERQGPLKVVLVGLGGTGNLSAWPRIATALRTVKGLTVVLYGYRPHPIAWYVGQLPGHEVHAVTDYQTAWACFQSADLAIVGAGVTALECLCVGIPTVLYAVNENQAALLPAWRAYGFPTLNRDVCKRLDDETRHGLSRAGLALIDGQGASRVLGMVM